MTRNGVNQRLTVEESAQIVLTCANSIAAAIGDLRCPGLAGLQLA